MKKILLMSVLVLFVGLLNGQQIIEYSHCDCIEKLNYSANNLKALHGPYEFICNEVLTEQGEYVDGRKNGKWISFNKKGSIISSIEYSNGVLNGDFSLYHFNGKPKLAAKFEEGLKQGEWMFFNAKGKVIKQGEFEFGLPVGPWTIYDKKGKGVISQFNYTTKEGDRSNSHFFYFDNNAILRDDQSGGYVVLSYPERNVKATTIPFGGYDLACDYFADYLNIPTILADTYTNYNFVATVSISNGIVSKVNVVYKEDHPHVPTLPTFPMLLQTDADSRLARVEHNEGNILFLQNRIFEIVNIIGPWIVDAETSEEIEIYIPYVLNDVRRY